MSTPEEIALAIANAVETARAEQAGEMQALADEIAELRLRVPAPGGSIPVALFPDPNFPATGTAGATEEVVNADSPDTSSKEAFTRLNSIYVIFVFININLNICIPVIVYSYILFLYEIVVRSMYVARRIYVLCISDICMFFMSYLRYVLNK